MKSKCNLWRQFSGRVVLFFAVGFLLLASRGALAQQKAASKPKIKQYPDAAVWISSEKAAEEFPGFEMIGEYIKDSQAMQVTAAEGRFYLSMYENGLPGAGWDGSSVTHEWNQKDSMRQRLIGWQKTDRSSEVTGKRPPADAIILFDGSNTDAWINGKIQNGFLTAGARTRQKFRDFRLYFEFLIPLKPEPPISHPHRGNSGVFAVGAYEVQIADTFGLDVSPTAWLEDTMLKPTDTWCGSIYGISPPNVNMCLPPLSWQSMEIEFKAARFDGDKKITSAMMSVTHNNVMIHDNIELPQGTGGGPSGPRPEVPEGRVVLQNHGNPNLFRNIWIVPNG